MSRFFPLLVFLASSGCAFAQNTAGELVDAGGRRIEQRVLVSLLAGNTWSTGTRGERVQTQYSADGKYIQTVRLADGKGGMNAGHFGDWIIDDFGRECQTRKNLKGAGAKRCRVWFVIGSEYFAADENPNERNSKLHKRTRVE